MISKVRDTIIWKSCDHKAREKNMFKQKDGKLIPFPWDFTC